MNCWMGKPPPPPFSLASLTSDRQLPPPVFYFLFMLPAREEEEEGEEGGAECPRGRSREARSEAASRPPGLAAMRGGVNGGLAAPEPRKAAASPGWGAAGGWSRAARPGPRAQPARLSRSALRAEAAGSRQPGRRDGEGGAGSPAGRCSRAAGPLPSGPASLSALRAGRGEPALWRASGRRFRGFAAASPGKEEGEEDDSLAGRGAWGGGVGGRRRQTYTPRMGGAWLPELRSLRGSVAPAAPGAGRKPGSGLRSGKPGLWPAVYSLRNPERPSQREMGRRGIAGGLPGRWGGRWEQPDG